MFKESADSQTPQLKKYLTPIGAWALSFGCAVGWGSFVMPGTTFLPLAGPMGTVLGMLIGGLIMLLIGVNYHYLMSRYQDSGGIYAFAKNEFGYDQGFIGAWFLLLVYMAIVWANATAIPIIFRNLFPGVLEIGPKYNVAGFDVYLLESVIASACIAFAGFVCICGGKISAIIQTIAAVVLIGGILLVAALIAAKGGISSTTINPAFVPNKSRGFQVFQIVALAPWAYVGFESISHSTEEFKFSPKKTLGVFIAALIMGAVAYSVLVLIAISAHPIVVSNWKGYVDNLARFSGLGGLPVFNAARHHLGIPGFVILVFAVAGAIFTGLIGNLIASSRLIFSMSKDDLFPKWTRSVNRFGVPYKTIMAITALSMVIPFFGRTAISWIIDVNTIGACVAYAYTSMAAFFRAKKENDPFIKFTGLVGFIVADVFTLYFLIPNLWSVEALTPQSYLIIIVWSLAGFLTYFYVMKRDKEDRFGHSTLSLLGLLFLVFFISMLWFREESHKITETALNEFNTHNVGVMQSYNIKQDYEERLATERYRERKIREVNDSLQIMSLIQMAVIMLALFIMFTVYRTMHRRERRMELQKITAEENSKAKSMFLSNMSHDLRTPMNAIIGYTELTREIENLPEEVSENLDKIDNSGRHLLSVINDILDLGRIESGKMTLEIDDTDLVELAEGMNVVFEPQMKGKGLSFMVNTEGIENRYVRCDSNRLDRILLNLISNAYKFTPEGGTVSVTLKQNGTGVADADALGLEGNSIGIEGQYEIRVKDNGMGMSPEFAATVFEAYSREHSVTQIQGTGLGMAITKSMVDLMGGTIRVESQKGKGSEFIINLDLDIIRNEDYAKKHRAINTDNGEDFSKYRVLLVEDQHINRDIAIRILKKFGFKYETAENGQAAVDMVAASEPGTYDIVLMDIQMPVMDGYTAAREIRKLDNKELSSIPIIAMSASAFAEDIKTAKDNGMNGHISKPIEVRRMIETISEFLN